MAQLTGLITFFGNSRARMRFSMGLLPNIKYGLEENDISYDLSEINKMIKDINFFKNSPPLIVWIKNTKTDKADAVKIDLSYFSGWDTNLDKIIEQIFYVDITSKLENIGN